MFEPICMGSSTEGASPPDMMDWMHVDFQIEVENGFSYMIEKRPMGMPRAVFFEYKINNPFYSPKWIPINCS